MNEFVPDDSGFLKVETDKSGHFIFQIGLDIEKLDVLKDRINDAHTRFISMPLLSEISSELEQLAMIDSIYGTNTIEGGDLTYEETEKILNLSDDEIKEEREKRVANLKKAYRYSINAADFHFEEASKKYGVISFIPNQLVLDINEDMFKELHELITHDLKHEFNYPRIYRDNKDKPKTRVGHEDVGGVYHPPRTHKDIQTLMVAFCNWANCKAVQKLPALYRAALIHYYFELIHPFWDGNGRTGRLAEATILRTAEYRYAPHAMAQYYLDNQLYYFTLLNKCRKNADKKIEKPNSDFVYFFLKGMLVTINRLHDRANFILSDILFDVKMERLHSEKKISERQYYLLRFLTEEKVISFRNELKQRDWYKILYKGVNEERAVSRDLNKLSKLHFIHVSKNGSIRLVHIKPELELVTHPYTNNC